MPRQSDIEKFSCFQIAVTPMEFLKFNRNVWRSQGYWTYALQCNNIPSDFPGYIGTFMSNYYHHSCKLPTLCQHVFTPIAEVQAKKKSRYSPRKT